MSDPTPPTPPTGPRPPTGPATPAGPGEPDRTRHPHWPLDEVWGDEQSERDAEAVVEELEATEPELARRWHDHPTIVPFKAVWRFIRRSGKRIAVTIAGSVVVVVGLLLVPLPGPGWAIVFGGLAILATEYVWARRLLQFAKQTVDKTVEVGRRNKTALRAATIVFAVVAVVVTWTFLFAMFRVGVPDGADPTVVVRGRGDLTTIATDTFGPRWPGSSVFVVADGDGPELIVKRTWLWMREASVHAVPVAGGLGFTINTGKIGYGLAKALEWAIVVLPIAFVPALLVYVVVARRTRRDSGADS